MSNSLLQCTCVHMEERNAYVPVTCNWLLNH